MHRLPTVWSSGPGRQKEGRQLTSLKDIQVELLVLSWRAGLFPALTEQCVPVRFCSQSCFLSQHLVGLLIESEVSGRPCVREAVRVGRGRPRLHRGRGHRGDRIHSEALPVSEGSKVGSGHQAP